LATFLGSSELLFSASNNTRVVLSYSRVWIHVARCTALSTHTTIWNTCCHNTAKLI